MSSAGSPTTAASQPRTPRTRPSPPTRRCPPVRAWWTRTAVPDWAASWTAAGGLSWSSRPGSNSSASASRSAASRAARRRASRERGATRGTPRVSACRAGTLCSPVSSPDRSVSPTADTVCSSAVPPGSLVSRVHSSPGAHSPCATRTGSATGTCGRTRSRSRGSRRRRALVPRSGASRSTWWAPTHQAVCPASSLTGRTSGRDAAAAPLSLSSVRASRRTVSAVGVGAWVISRHCRSGRR